VGASGFSWRETQSGCTLRVRVPGIMARRTKVLFICLGNSCRSPMAEAVAREIASDVMEVSSAGLAPLGHIMEMTRRALVANGYPAEGLASKPILPQAWDAADLVINMSGRPRDLAFQEFDKVEDWDVDDPYGDDIETYQRIVIEIEGRVRDLARRLRARKTQGARR